MKIATVLLRHKKKKGVTRRFNQHEFAINMGRGKFIDWELAGGETHGDEGSDIEQAIHAPEQYLRDKNIVESDELSVVDGTDESTDVTINTEESVDAVVENSVFDKENEEQEVEEPTEEIETTVKRGRGRPKK